MVSTVRCSERDLVDELHLVLLPALVGGSGTPTVFEGPPLTAPDAATLLRLHRCANQSRWSSLAPLRNRLN